MSEKVLSQEELKALLDAEDGAKGDREKQIVDYDFAHPNRLGVEQVRTLTRVHEGIAIDLSRVVSDLLRCNATVNVVSVSEQMFSSFRKAMPTPTVIEVLAVPPFTEKALLTVDMKLAFSIIDRMLGGPGKPPAKLRPLTAIERGLLDNVLSKFIERIAAGWKELTAFTPTVETVEMDPDKVEVIPSAETLLVVTFTLAGGEMAGGEACFCLPLVALEALLGRLVAKPVKFAATKRNQTPDQRKQIEQVLAQGSMAMTVQLGTATITLGEVLDIKVGDVLVLDQGQSDSVIGRVNGRPRVRGRVGRLGKNLAIVVEKTVPAEKPPVEKTAPERGAKKE
jgi:flagellar motor switch protein FliM